MDNKKNLITFTAIAVGTFIYNYLKPIKSKVEVINGFKFEKILGEWYQIAHLKNHREKPLTNIKFTFLKDDLENYEGVLTGYNLAKQINITKVSKIKLNDDNLGIFRAAFYTPFFTNFHIVRVQEKYEDMLIFGNNLDSMRILSREKEIPKDRIELYIQYAKSCGFEPSNIIWD